MSKFTASVTFSAPKDAKVSKRDIVALVKGYLPEGGKAKVGDVELKVSNPKVETA